MQRKPNYGTTYHRDHTVTIWNCYAQQWERTGRPSDRVLASLSPSERERVLRHCRALFGVPDPIKG